MNIEDYPIGTKAYASSGGYWQKTERGWKWCTGDTFPRPGGDVIRYEVPNNPVELTASKRTVNQTAVLLNAVKELEKYL